MDKILNYLAYVLDELFKNIKIRAQKFRIKRYKNIHDSVLIGMNVQLIGPNDAFYIGERTYINEAIISAGENSKVIIGKNCAIGYGVSIKAVTHDNKNPCPNEKGVVSLVEADIKIGDFCWIGDNVFIKEGVTLGNNVTVGANSVVTKSIPDNVIIAGVPAKIISGSNN